VVARVSRATAVTITFANKIKAESIVLSAADGTLISVTRSWNAAGTVLTLTPAANLAATTAHILSMAGVVDIYGQLLTLANIKFTTGA
jgi:hypothetical protein